MAELKIPQKTLQDNFNLQDFKDDFNALNSEIAENRSELNSEITNNVNELNSKIDTNKSLTDSEISKLKEIANTWESFKNTGGIIGGDIKIPRGFALCGTINGNRDALIYQSSQPNDNGRVIVGSSGQTTQIASELRPEVYWNLHTHQIILNSDYVSDKSLNGYTKFPNGMIIQWGQSGIQSGQVSNSISFPIVFPNKCLSVTCNLTGSETVNPVDCMYSVGNITASYFDIHYNKPRNEYQGLSWIAIGY